MGQRRTAIDHLLHDGQLIITGLVVGVLLAVSFQTMRRELRREILRTVRPLFPMRGSIIPMDEPDNG